MKKRCSWCKLSKEISEFAKNKLKPDGLQTHCRKCKALFDQKYYISHKVEHKLRVQKYNTKNRIRVWEYLQTHPCIDCGENNPIVLEFDHREQSEKKESVSYLLFGQKSAWSTLLEEINKCDVRCANCHRIKIAKQFGWYKYLVP